MAFRFWTDKGDIVSSFLPNDTATQFGGAGASAAQMLDSGNIYRNILATAVSPAATAGDYVVDVFALPAGTFDKVGRGLDIIASGNVASNTNVKRVKLWWNATAPVVGSVVSGGTLVADSGNYSTTGAAGYSLEANIFKTANTNSQLCLHQSAQVGAVVGALVAATIATATESGVIWIAVTANATTATTDILHYATQVFGMN